MIGFSNMFKAEIYKLAKLKTLLKILIAIVIVFVVSTLLSTTCLFVTIAGIEAIEPSGFFRWKEKKKPVPVIDPDAVLERMWTVRYDNCSERGNGSGS